MPCMYSPGTTKKKTINCLEPFFVYFYFFTKLLLTSGEESLFLFLSLTFRSPSAMIPCGTSEELRKKNNSCWPGLIYFYFLSLTNFSKNAIFLFCVLFFAR